MKTELLKKFFSFSIGGYINIIIGLWIVPITTRILSPEQYGIFSLINTVVNILGVICFLGIDQGFVRYFYEENEENRGDLLLKCLYFPITSIIFFSFFLFFFNSKISIFLLGEKDNFIWKILVISIIFIMINRFSLLVIRMNQKGKLYSFFTTLLKILEFIFILLLYKRYGNSYKTLIISNLYSLIIITILSILYERKIWNFKGKIKTPKTEILKYSFPFSLTIALNWLMSSSDKIVIKIFSNLTELGFYSGAFKIISLLAIVQTSFTTFWTPVMFEHNSKKPEDTIFFKNIFNYLSVIFFSLGVGIIATRDIIILFLGNKFYQSIFIMPMLVFIPIMYLLSEITVVGIYFKKKTKYLFYISLIVSTFNFLGNIVLVPKLGARGAAISTGLAYILFFSLKTFFSNKLINYSFNLKKIYLIIFLIFIYALSLTFYDNFYYTISIGILLEMIILLIYLPVLKEIFSKYLKDVLR